MTFLFFSIQRRSNIEETKIMSNSLSLRDLDKDESLNWIDDTVPVNYINITDWNSFGWGKIYGTMNKNTGAYKMKGSLTATHRGICGRAGECSK